MVAQMATATNTAVSTVALTGYFCDRDMAQCVSSYFRISWRRAKQYSRYIFSMNAHMTESLSGAYWWAPEIPTKKRLASAVPSTCELVHNRAPSFQKRRGASVPVPHFWQRSRPGRHHCFGSGGRASEARSGREGASTGTAPRSSEAATQSPAHNLAPLTAPTSLQPIGSFGFA